MTSRLRSWTQRLAQRKMLLGLIVAAIGAGLAVVAWQSVNGVPFQNRYRIEVEVPAESPILKAGDSVRVAGRFAGLITDVEPDDGAVRVTAELRPDFAPIGNDAEARVRVRSIIYLTYLEIDPGNIDDPMPEGGTIPLARSGSNVDLLEVVQLFDEKTREHFANTVRTVGSGVAGRGEDLNVALADLGASAPDLTSQLEAAIARPGAIATVIEGTARTVSGLRGVRADDVGQVVGSGAAVVGAIAAHPEELGASIDLLRPFEDEFLATAPLATRTLRSADKTFVALKPAARALEDALPAINELLGQGDEIRAETARLTAAINPVLAAAAPVIASLQPTVASIDPLLRPLGQLTRTVEPYADDIRRAGLGLVDATSTPVDVGSASGSIALRFAPILTCHQARDPYPEPGETLEHSQSC
jgi:phospholipid/cholesterol/gamma-HCH transport system substrate-binding protein